MMKHIAWGMPTLIELETIDENVELCQFLGLNFIELNLNMPEYQPDQLDIEKLLHLKEKHHIYYTMHLPEDFDIANFNEGVRDAYEKVFRDTVEIARQLNAPILNMHMNQGVHFKLPNEKKHLYHKYKDYYMDRIRDFSSNVMKLLGASEIKLCIENTGIYDLDYITAAVDELLLNDQIFLTWDIGHDHSSGLKDKDYILHNHNRLKHMHIHDAIGIRNHLPVFTGDIDIMDMFNLASEKDCSCVIETKSVDGLKESIQNMRMRGIL